MPTPHPKEGPFPSADNPQRIGLRIGVVNQKGGPGKTTISTHVAGALAAMGAKTLYIDTDKQGSGMQWVARRAEAGYPRLFTSMAFNTGPLHAEIKSLAQGYDVVVIDGPPHVETMTRAVIASTDIAIIPVQPSPYDVWAADPVCQLIEMMRVTKPDYLAAFLVNRRTRTRIGGSIKKILTDQPIPVLDADIGDRTVFPQSAAAGLLAFEVDPSSAAADEVLKVTREILRAAGFGIPKPAEKKYRSVATPAAA